MSDRKLKDILFEIINDHSGYSDIMIETDAPIMVKTPRGWAESESLDIPSMDMMHEFLEGIEPNWESLLKNEGGSLNRPLDLINYRLRINAYLANSGSKLMASIRRIPKYPMSMKELGLPASVNLILENTSGLVLISGATGSGKTTTVASLLAAVNDSRNAHVVTIEDPIEYVHSRNRSVFSQREIGVDTNSFAAGVKDAMRQRPDIIVIGEIRDRETAEQALIAGESGHLVIGTLHANSVPGTISKMLGFFNSQEREAKEAAIESTVVGVINQTLIPTKEGTGVALAIEYLANHKREYSNILTHDEKLRNILEQKAGGVSFSMRESISKLIAKGEVSKADAVRCVSGNMELYSYISAMAA